MIPVYQRHTGVWGAGDCAWACLASIFEEPLESFAYEHLLAPDCDDVRKLTECRWPHLTYHERDLATNYRLVDGPDVPGVGAQRWTYDVPTAWEPPHSGYWIATVASQSLKRPESDPYYPMPALHAVVMHGWNLVHDPNPNNRPTLTAMSAQSWWTTTTAEVPWPT